MMAAMSANSILLWAIAGFVGLAAAMMLVAPEPPVSSLERSLGPDVVSEPL
jgi:hypothetical protein